MGASGFGYVIDGVLRGCGRAVEGRFLRLERPVWKARTIASTRSRTLSFSSKRVTWVLTVVSLMNSSCPISVLEKPCVMRRKTSISRPVSVSAAGEGSVAEGG